MQLALFFNPQLNSLQGSPMLRQMRVAEKPIMDSVPIVLCIDDFKPGLQTRKNFLEYFGFKVLIASSGAEGLQIVKTHHIDAVVLDYRMPEMDGEELALQIRQLSLNMPLLLLSGFVREIPERLKQTVNVYLTKGDPPGLLVSALSELTASTLEQRKAAQRNEDSPAKTPAQFKRKTV
jgi:CheY-like chemotaxis protein